MERGAQAVDMIGFYPKLDWLVDVKVPRPEAGQFLYWNDSDKQWESLGALEREAGKFLSTDGKSLIWKNITGGGDMLRSNNLSDLDSVASARVNLGLGSAAIKDVGRSPGEVCPGEHCHAISDITGLVERLLGFRKQWENFTPYDGVSIPLSPNSPGAKGDEAFDDNYYYMCISDNTWVRTHIARSWEN
jgi:hypothetical protein